MKICFVIPTELGSVGCRLLSSYLRMHNHATRLVFIRNLTPEADGIRYTRNMRYECSERLRAIVLELAHDCDIVGFYVLTQYFEPLGQIADSLRQRGGKTVVFGGTHATLRPEDCLKHSDVVCIGDGEETILDIAGALHEGRDLTGIAGTATCRDGVPFVSEPRQPGPDLDRYPHLDFSFRDHFVVDAAHGKEHVLEVTPQSYRRLQKAYPDSQGREWQLVPYKTVTARGCLYTCSYCSMGSLRKTVPYRQRSPESVIDELRQVIGSFGDVIDVISFSDDTFLSHSDGWLRKFSDLYSSHIERPFRVLGHPLQINHDKILMLRRAGCMHVGMGIESLSHRTLFEVYDRKTSIDRVVAAANTLVDIAAHNNMLAPTFDLIWGNPYETRTELLETLRNLTKISRPAKYVYFNLCFFPGSRLFARAEEDGIIDPSDPLHNRSWYSNEPEIDPDLTVLFRAKRGGVPNFLILAFTPPFISSVLCRLLRRYPSWAEEVSRVLDAAGRFGKSRRIYKLWTRIVRRAGIEIYHKLRGKPSAGKYPRVKSARETIRKGHVEPGDPKKRGGQ